MLVISVLVRARDEWDQMDERERRAYAKHVLAIGKFLDECATTGVKP